MGQKRLMRGVVLACMATLLPVTVGMEVLWWAHDWARRLAEQGHITLLIHFAQF